MQVHNRYLVTQTDDGVTVIDQPPCTNAFCTSNSAGGSAGAISNPKPVGARTGRSQPGQTAAVLENRELPAELGLKVEPFGGDTVLVAGYPAMLANIDPAEVLRASSSGSCRAESGLKRATCSTICCTRRLQGGIKAGDRLPRRKSPRCWNSATWWTTPTTAPTAGPPHWSSPAEFDRQFGRSVTVGRLGQTFLSAVFFDTFRAGIFQGRQECLPHRAFKFYASTFLTCPAVAMMVERQKGVCRR